MRPPMATVVTVGFLDVAVASSVLLQFGAVSLPWVRDLLGTQALAANS